MGAFSHLLTVGPLALWLAVSPALPPEHVHEDAGHHHAFAHRHLLLADHDHDGSSFTHDDDRTVWLDEVPIAPPVHTFPGPEPSITHEVGLVPCDVTWATVTADEVAPTHGPPRASLSLRAPPRLPA